MKTPGVTVRPLRQMTGGHEFNEMFFENVHVPRTNLLGELNGGWRVGMTTLMNERGTSAFAVWLRYRITYEELVEMARKRHPQRPARDRGSGNPAAVGAGLHRPGRTALRQLPDLLPNPQGRHSGAGGFDFQGGVVGTEPADERVGDGAGGTEFPTAEGQPPRDR